MSAKENKKIIMKKKKKIAFIIILGLISLSMYAGIILKTGLS
jgi:hypothetical protein